MAHVKVSVIISHGRMACVRQFYPPASAEAGTCTVAELLEHISRFPGVDGTVESALAARIVRVLGAHYPDATALVENDTVITELEGSTEDEPRFSVHVRQPAPEDEGSCAVQ